MTRLTTSVVGDPLTFRPVTSSIVRKSKDGDVNVVILFFGTHYNVKMDGIIQLDTGGDVEPGTSSIGVNNGLLEVDCQREVGGSGHAFVKGSFSSFTYFYPGLKIKGHLKLDETSHSAPVPELEGHYHFADLLSDDALGFVLKRNENECRFTMVETVDGVDTELFGEDLAALVDEVFFEFVFLENGKCKLYFFSDYGTQNQSKTRKWIGDLKARIGECNVTIHNHNAEEVLHTVSSDFIYIEYPKIFLKFDRAPEDRFIGNIQMFDDMNSVDEADWSRVRSRDRGFVGNRVIENGMVRMIIKTDDPVIEIYGWNYEAAIPSWEKVLTILPNADSGSKSIRVQNIVFEYFSIAQIKGVINFGTSVYSFIMSRGDPYITFLSTDKKKFMFTSEKSRFAVDMDSGDYTLANTVSSGSPVVRANAEETLSGFTMLDNWYAVYNHSVDKDVVGWISNAVQPNEFKIMDKLTHLEYEVTYDKRGNIFGVGVLPSFPTNLVGGIPFPFTVNTQDRYVKWRANEAILAFKEIEIIRRR